MIPFCDDSPELLTLSGYLTTPSPSPTTTTSRPYQGLPIIPNGPLDTASNRAPAAPQSPSEGICVLGYYILGDCTETNQLSPSPSGPGPSAPLVPGLQPQSRSRSGSRAGSLVQGTWASSRDGSLGYLSSRAGQVKVVRGVGGMVRFTVGRRCLLSCSLAPHGPSSGSSPSAGTSP